MDKELEDIIENFPLVSKELLDNLKKCLDIRKMVKYCDTAEYLRGIQDAIDFLESRYKDQNTILEDEE